VKQLKVGPGPLYGAVKRDRCGGQEIATLGFERLLKVKETVDNDTWQLLQI